MTSTDQTRPHAPLPVFQTSTNMILYHGRTGGLDSFMSPVAISWLEARTQERSPAARTRFIGHVSAGRDWRRGSLVLSRPLDPIWAVRLRLAGETRRLPSDCRIGAGRREFVSVVTLLIRGPCGYCWADVDKIIDSTSNGLR